jgi:hypothetical protein
MSNRIYLAVAAFGTAATIGVLTFNPTAAGAVMATTGGVLAGAAVAEDSRREKERKASEGTRVAQAFRFQYDKNKGLISPEELSFSADITLERVLLFLEGLTETQNGQKIPTERGLVYSFPHPQNVLDVLTQNSQAWVDARTQPLLDENQRLKQAIVMLQQQQQVAPPMMPVPMVQQPPTFAKREHSKKMNEKERIDPWNSLL